MRINVSGLEFYGFHGVSPEERKVGQRLLVDLELEVRSKAEQTDRIQDTVDYGAVSLKAMEVGQQTQFHTLERLAQEIGSTLIRENPLIQRVQVSVTKPYPPIGAVIESVGVTHEISR